MMPLNLVAVIALISALASSLGTWMVTSAVKNGELATLEKQVAERDLSTTVASLNELTGAMQSVHDAATRAATEIGATKTTLANIKKELQHAPPLPVDCSPDAIRMRSLTDSVNTVNRALGR